MIEKRLRHSGFQQTFQLFRFIFSDKRARCPYNNPSAGRRGSRPVEKSSSMPYAWNVAGEKYRASRVAVSPRDVSRNMRALEESADERGAPLSSCPLSPFHAIRKDVRHQNSIINSTGLYSSEKDPVPRDLGFTLSSRETSVDDVAIDRNLNATQAENYTYRLSMTLADSFVDLSVRTEIDF